MKDNILIATIAATSALSGVLISQAISILLSFFDRRHQKRILLRKKYEEMIFHFVDSLEGTTLLNLSPTLQQLHSQAVQLPCIKALSLCLLYFPDLVDDMNNYILSQRAYYNFVVDSFNEKNPFTAGGQAWTHPEAKILFNNIKETKSIMDNLMIDKVKKYIKA